MCPPSFRGPVQALGTTEGAQLSLGRALFSHLGGKSILWALLQAEEEESEKCLGHGYSTFTEMHLP